VEKKKTNEGGTKKKEEEKTAEENKKNGVCRVFEFLLFVLDVVFFRIFFDLFPCFPFALFCFPFPKKIFCFFLFFSL